jgi:hypothetical protein
MTALIIVAALRRRPKEAEDVQWRHHEHRGRCDLHCAYDEVKPGGESPANKPVPDRRRRHDVHAAPDEEKQGK